jgi:hypothetical protein
MHGAIPPLPYKCLFRALPLRERAILGAEEKRQIFAPSGRYILVTILTKLSMPGIRNTFLLFS